MPAASFVKSGSESVDELNNDSELKSRIESLRLDAGARMGLGDVQRKVIPKMCLTAPPWRGGAVTTRTLTPHDCHTSIGELGAVSVATACVLSSTVAAELPAIRRETTSRSPSSIPPVSSPCTCS